MTEADLRAFIQTAYDDNRPIGPGELFDYVLHNLPEKLPQKRIRACIAKMGLDKIPKPPCTVTFVEPPPSTPDDDQRPELYQKVVTGLQVERPETVAELREMFDPRD